MSKVPYEAIPKKQARYLLSKLEEFREQARSDSPQREKESDVTFVLRTDAAALHGLLGLLRFHADNGPLKR